MVVMKLFGLVCVIFLVIVLMKALSRDYYDYKLADMNAGYTLPDWSIWDAFLRVIGKKKLP